MESPKKELSSLKSYMRLEMGFTRSMSLRILKQPRDPIIWRWVPISKSIRDSFEASIGRTIAFILHVPLGSVQFFCGALKARSAELGGGMVRAKNEDRFRTPVQADAGESLVMKSHPKEFWTTEKDKYIKI